MSCNSDNLPVARWLEIGPGTTRLPGSWTTVDCKLRKGVVDYVCRWGEDPLPFSAETFELVYACHVLEHVPWYRTVDALREVNRVLRPCGRIEIHVPDLDVLLRAVTERRALDDHTEEGLNHELNWMHWVAERLFHCGQAEQWHRACFNADHLRWCLMQAGFQDIRLLRSERGTDHGMINLGMEAVKGATVFARH